MSQQHKILVVDDTPANVKLLVDVLMARGFDVNAAVNGEEALEKVVQDPPDLILLDIMMPGVGGTETRSLLMNDPDTKKIPIIFLTGLRAPHLTKKPSLDGVKVVGKSKDFAELLDVIREVLEKKAKN